MHNELVVRAAAMLALLGFGPAIAGQDASTVRAVDAVMGFRRAVMADTLRFDACTVFAATGRPADFPAGIRPANLAALDRPGVAPCDVTEAPVRLPHKVYVDSLALGDSIGHVYLTIRRGEWVHRETFTLPRLRDGRWGVREVRTWGAFQAAPPPPGDRRSTAPSRARGVGAGRQCDVVAAMPRFQSLRPPAAPHCPPPAAAHWPSSPAIRHPPSAIRHPPPATRRPGQIREGS